MTEPIRTTRSLFWAAFWVVLPFLVLGLAFWFLVVSKPKSGWTQVPQHPQAVATVLFAKNDRGLKSVAFQEPYTVLGFSKAWKEALSLSKRIDTLCRQSSAVGSRAGQWVYRANGQIVYLEILELDDSVSLDTWMGRMGTTYTIRALQEGTLAEPQSDLRVPFLLFWRQHIIISSDPVALEELVEHPLLLELERMIPKPSSFGLVLHPEHWSLKGGASTLPFYPMERMASEARSILLLPTYSTKEGWGFAGMAARSLKRLRWPSVQTFTQKPIPKEILEDGWQVRIGQGLAGNRFMVGQEDSLAGLRQAIADKLVAVKLALPPTLPGQPKPIRLEFTCEDGPELVRLIQEHFRPAKGYSGSVRGDVPGKLFGLDIPGFDTCFVAAQGRLLVLSSQPIPKDHLPRLQNLPAGQDLVLQFSPANQWGYMQAHGPKPLQSLVQTLPITLSHFGAFRLKLTGDGVEASIDILSTPLLGKVKPLPRPFFTNLFNSPLSFLSPVQGKESLGFAVSQLGRAYVFKPGRLSLGQTQMGVAKISAGPVYLTEKGWVIWASPGKLYAMDTTGRIPHGFPLDVAEEVLAMAPGAKAAIGAGLLDRDPALLSLGSEVVDEEVPLSTLPGAVQAQILSSGARPLVLFRSGGLNWAFYHGATKAQKVLTNYREVGPIGQVTAPHGETVLVAVTPSGQYFYEPLDTRLRGFTKQLYLPEREARFELLTLPGGQAIGVARYTPETTSFYDIQGHKRWETAGNDPLNYRRTGMSELEYLALRRHGDTLQGVNLIGQTAFQLAGVKEPYSALFPSIKGLALLAVPAGRELKWYRVE